MKISILLVHYRTPDLLVTAVGAWHEQIASLGAEAEVIVIDNGSSPEDRERFAGLPARILHSPTNSGYASALNWGVRRSEGEILVLANPDVEPRQGCLGRLVEGLDTFAVVGPRFTWDRQGAFLLPPTEQRGRGAELQRRWSRSELRYRDRWRQHARRFWTAEQSVPTWDLSGALLVLKRSVWNRVGPFDEGFPLYFEETDWLFRLRRQGLQGGYLPTARAIHWFNQSGRQSAKVSGWFEASRRRFERRWYGRTTSHLLDRWAPNGSLRARAAAESENGPSSPSLDPASLPREFRGRPAGDLWLELSPSSLGAPAAAAAPGSLTEHALPEDLLDHLEPGRYFLCWVDGSGLELGRGHFRHFRHFRDGVSATEAVGE